MPNQCPICLNEVVGEICGFHTQDADHKVESRKSKIINDFLMRGKVPKRLPKSERSLSKEDE